MSALLDRREAVATLLKPRRETIVVTGLGSPTYDVAAAGDDPLNAYLWGAMGGTAVFALGLALAQPTKPVLAVTGDGEMLMGIGSLATIALQAPKNLAIVIIDNGLYGETGGQASHTSVADLAAVAKACGIADVATLTTPAQVKATAEGLHWVGGGPRVLVLKVGAEERERVLPSRDGHLVRLRVRQALGVDSP